VVVASARSTVSLPDSGRFVALDSFRGIAALMVAAFHMHGGGPLLQSAVIRNGWLAVDFFFVLSGFVIAESYGTRLSQGFPISRFMVLRLGRIYPLHLAVLAALVAQEAAQWYLAIPGASIRPAFSSGHTLGELPATLFLVQGLQEPPSSGWSLQSWSISVELWLYVLAALAWRVLGSRAWIAALGAAALSAYLLQRNDFFTPLSSAFLRGVLGFGFGMGCSAIWRSPPRPRLGPAATLAEGAAVAVAVFLLAIDDAGHVFQGLIDLAFAALILVFAAERGWFSRQLHRRAFVLLGTISYSLYMIHPLVIARGFDVLRLFGLGRLRWAGGVQLREISAPPLFADALGMLVLAAVVGVAWVTWRWIEAPARSWSRKLASRMGVAREEAVAPTI
jgi:peptidoglycan/LPS O-acetylase OafA/YrhL